MLDVKTDDNTPIEDIDIIGNPITETILFRYLLSNHWCRGKDVLDCACGHGAGTKILKVLGANSVLGMDKSEIALQRATKYNVEGVCFVQGDLCEMSSEYDDSFDTIISIETFEHLPPDKIGIYLDNLNRWCRKNGTIVITTPRRRKDEWKYDGGTHLREYSLDEFVKVLSEHFNNTNVKLIGIQEVNFQSQLISVLTKDLYDARVIIAIIEK